MTELGVQLQNKLSALQAQREDIDQQIAVYQAALQNEQRLNGTADTTPAHTSPSTHGQDSPKADTDFVRDFIHRRGAKGASAADIKAAAKRKNLAMTEKFPYLILWKLKKQDDIILDQGLYYPPPE